ncbi:MAG: hypothetical protein AMS27_07370 [Bacteroides sp. SM23_62_1]|nr:MAG: hypothetical protein AMS27_07370 [Bacteroides sp. SM23_62_1]
MKTIVKILVFLILSMAFTGCAEDKKDITYVSVVFDVEDYITPASEGIDDIPKWLAEIMSDVGVTGTFFVIGEKARSLESRGRQDVIAAMAKHDIGSHTNMGSIHPTVTEILENADWDTGVQHMLYNESKGFDELEQIFGVPVSTLARHGGSYGPQLVYALGQLGKGYVYSPIHLPGHNAVWFCNTLNFHGDYGFFDNTYYKDELFNPVFDSVQQSFQKEIQGLDVVAFFACHPCKVRTEQFWDFNYYEGANPPLSECKAPDLRPLESMETAKKNFRRLMEYLKSLDNISITTFNDLMNRFSYQEDYISRNDLQHYAESILKGKSIIIDSDFSPAEMFAALVGSLTEYAKTENIPDESERGSPLGPMEMPDSIPGIFEVSNIQVFILVGEAYNWIRDRGYLPAYVSVDENRVGTGSLLALFSELYLDILSGNPKESYTIIPFDPFPRENEKAIISEIESFKYWPVHQPDLDMSNLVYLTRLQLWTLKPAREK